MGWVFLGNSVEGRRSTSCPDQPRTCPVERIPLSLSHANGADGPPLSTPFSFPTDALTGGTVAEQEVENLSGLSPNPEKAIFVVRENGTTCLMAEFAAKFIVPYDVWASNFVDVRTFFFSSPRPAHLLGVFL